MDTKEELEAKIKAVMTTINKLKRRWGSIQLAGAVGTIRDYSKDIPKFSATRDEIVDYLATLGLVLTTSTYDRYYALTNWVYWTDIIVDDIVKTIGYVPETMDCDNFAFAFASLSAMLYGLTSALPTYGTAIKEGEDYRHYFNTIITKENGLFNAYLYEPITGKPIKIEKNKEIFVGGMTYYPQHLHLF